MYTVFHFLRHIGNLSGTRLGNYRELSIFVLPDCVPNSFSVSLASFWEISLSPASPSRHQSIPSLSLLLSLSLTHRRFPFICHHDLRTARFQLLCLISDTWALDQISCWPLSKLFFHLRFLDLITSNSDKGKAKLHKKRYLAIIECASDLKQLQKISCTMSWRLHPVLEQFSCPGFYQV